MGRFDIQAPGAMAGDAITRYFADLEQRRRQQMQDQLALDREKRLATHDTEQSALAREQLASLKELRKQQADAAEQKSVTDALTLTGIGGGVSPEMVQKAQGVGLGGMVAPAAPANQESVTPETDPAKQQGIYPGIIASSAPSVGNSAPATAGFSRGTAAERKTAETKAAVRKVIESNPELAKQPGIQTALELAEATGEYSGVYSALATMTKPQTPEVRSAGGYLFEYQPDDDPTTNDWKKVAEGRPPADRSTLSATSEGAMITRLQNQWDKAQGQNREMQRQFQLMKTGLDRFNAGDKNGGSQAVLVTFQKILDPVSVVRESEYARSAQGLGFLNRLEGMYQKAVAGGAGVPAADLAAMVETARQFMEGVKHSTDGVRARSARTADRYGLPHDLIFSDVDVPAPGDPGGGGGKLVRNPGESPDAFAKRYLDWKQTQGQGKN